MGARYTAPADRGAGRQGTWRPLSLFEAEDALAERLGRILQMVERLRVALHQHHGEDSPLNARIDRIYDAIAELDLDVEYVHVRVRPNEVYPDEQY